MVKSLERQLTLFGEDREETGAALSFMKQESTFFPPSSFAERKRAFLHKLARQERISISDTRALRYGMQGAKALPWD